MTVGAGGGGGGGGEMMTMMMMTTRRCFNALSIGELEARVTWGIK